MSMVLIELMATCNPRSSRPTFTAERHTRRTRQRNTKRLPANRPDLVKFQESVYFSKCPLGTGTTPCT